MSTWFRENPDASIHQAMASLAVEVEEVLYTGQSPYQKLEIVRTKSFGNMMILDDCIMLTEAHEYAYHEMIAHVPLFSGHPAPRVLIIGGGDGGTAREVLRHPRVEYCKMVEIDALVVEKSREFFPQVSVALDDPRLDLHIGDAIEYIQDTSHTYDLILIDSTDPIGPAAGLFRKAFYEQLTTRLNPGGKLVSQAESPYFFAQTQAEFYETLKSVFAHVHMYTSAIPFYPSGYWAFVMASPSPLSLDPVRLEEAVHIQADLHYYNPEIHRGAFALPNFLQRKLGLLA